MKKQSLFIITSFVMVCVGVWACSKSQTPTKTNPKAVAALMSSSIHVPCNTPTVEDGMLVFKDDSQYQCYYDFVNGIQDDTTGNDQDSLLLDIETNLGYQSIRSLKLKEFETQNAIGWKTYQEVPDEDWIYNRAVRSILNQDREAKIGNTYIKYFNSEFLIHVDAAHKDALTQIRRLPSTATLEDILSLDIKRDFISVSSLSITDRIFGSNIFGDGTGKWGTQTPMGTWHLSGTVYGSPECNTTANYAYFEGFFAIDPTGVPRKCTYVIEMHDVANTILPGVVSTLGPQQSILAKQTANYGAGTYHPRVVVYYGNNIVGTRTFEVTVRGIAGTCTSSLHQKQYSLLLDANHVMKGEAIFHTYNNIFQQPQSEYSGYTEMLARDGNGSWNRRKNKDTHLCVTIDGDIRQDDNSCTQVSGTNPSHADGCDKNTNRKSKSVGFSGIKRFNYIHVVHIASIDGGVSGTFDQLLSPCE